MKELSIEQKAKRYDEAIKKAEVLYKTAEPMSGCNVLLETVFPELAELEEEKIRKALINGFNKLDKSAVWYNGITNAQILDWLEKQGEHANFRNKIQIGDKVTRNKDGVLVNLSQLNRVAKVEEKQGEQKPTWSEEDARLLDNCISLIEDIDCTKEEQNWLKGIKDRIQSKRVILEKLEEWLDEYVSSLADVDTASLICSFKNYLDGKLPKSIRPQPKQEWGEEEKRILSNINLYIRKARDYQDFDKENIEEAINWLKFLRPQQWKPSKEQMHALHDLNLTGNISYVGQEQELINLYNDLKKLKGE